MAAVAAAIAGTYHGAEQMRLGIENQDAKTNHAKHLAITHLTSQAKQESQPEESA